MSNTEAICGDCRRVLYRRGSAECARLYAYRRTTRSGTPPSWWTVASLVRFWHRGTLGWASNPLRIFFNLRMWLTATWFNVRYSGLLTTPISTPTHQQLP